MMMMMKTRLLLIVRMMASMQSLCMAVLEMSWVLLVFFLDRVVSIEENFQSQQLTLSPQRRK